MLQSQILRRVWVSIGFCVSAAAALAQTIQTPTPPSVGDKWTYRFHNTGDKHEPYLFTNEVQSIDATSAWVLGESQDPKARNPKYVWRYDLKRAEFVERFVFDPSKPNGAGRRTLNRQSADPEIQFPMAVGQKFTLKQAWNNLEGYDDFKVEVQAYEKIRVEAGEFDAYRLSYTGFWVREVNPGAGLTGRVEMIRWYAPAAKQFIKSTYANRQPNSLPWAHNNTELVKWEPAATPKN